MVTSYDGDRFLLRVLVNLLVSCLLNSTHLIAQTASLRLPLWSSTNGEAGYRGKARLAQHALARPEGQ